MKIKRIVLKNFKRFTNLELTNIPETAKIVVIVGPNGSGKSSLFDAFIHWQRQFAGWGIDNDMSYFRKKQDDEFTWNETVKIDTYSGINPTKSSVYMRTAYRNDPDFNITNIQSLQSPTEHLRVSRSIQNDQTVSQNYQRLVYETVAGIYNINNDTKTVAKLRDELIGDLRRSMRAVFGSLILNNISDPLGGGTFLFDKGLSKAYNYKNLSGGEKAAFDLLLDIHIKRKYYSDAVWCIDEMETHLHTRVQGSLMREMFNLVPDDAQLWVTTHSLGVMRSAQLLGQQFPGSVALIDFDGVDPDDPQTLSPSSVGRIAVEKMLSIALDDLSCRLSPPTIIMCEGSSLGNRRKNFDAEIYNRILGGSADVLFVSGGSSSEVSSSASVVHDTLKNIASGSIVISLCDRDDKSDEEVIEFERDGNIVLPQRNLESYLMADDVLSALCNRVNKPQLYDQLIALKRAKLADSVARGNKSDDLKSASGEIFVDLVRILELSRAGNNKDAFMRDTLAPLIVPGMVTYNALKAAIIDRIPV